jgi:transposase-like protein
LAVSLRSLVPVYPVVFFDALRVEIRDEGLVKNQAVYVALALNPEREGRARALDRTDRKRPNSGSGSSTSSRRAVSTTS